MSGLIGGSDSTSVQTTVNQQADRDAINLRGGARSTVSITDGGAVAAAFGFGAEQFSAALGLAREALVANGNAYTAAFNGLTGYTARADAERTEFARTVQGGDSERIFALGRYLLIAAVLIVAFYLFAGRK